MTTLALPAYASSIPQPDYLPGPNESETYSGSETQDYVLNTTIPRVINIAIAILGIAAFIGILISAIFMLTAYGNEDKINRAKTTLQYSLLGFVLIMLSYAIVSIVVSVALPEDNTTTESTEESPAPEAFNFWIQTAYAANDDSNSNDEKSPEDILNTLLPNENTLIDDSRGVSLPSGDLVSEVVPALITNLFYMVGLLIFIAIMYGGILLVIGRGNDEALTKAKNIISYSAIAIVLVSLGYAIIYGIATLNLDNSSTSTSDDVFTEQADDSIL